MSRPLRLVALTTALLVTAALVPATASAESRIAPASTSSAERPAAPSGGITVLDTAATSTSFSRIAPTGRTAGRSATTTSQKAATWPIGGGRASLSVHAVTATGSASQQLSRVQMAHFRPYGGVMQATVDLLAAPDPTNPATLSYILLRWGYLTADQATCSSPSGAGVAFSNTDTDTQSNPVYNGSRITVKPFQYPLARTATYNCAFADSNSAPDGTGTLYDSVINRATLFRQKPILTIKVKGRDLKARGYTRIPVRIINSRGTVATAPKIRLRVKARGLKVRYNPRVGTIRPGASKKGAIYVKDNGRGLGKATLVLTSKNYTKRLTLRERRR